MGGGGACKPLSVSCMAASCFAISSSGYTFWKKSSDISFYVQISILFLFVGFKHDISSKFSILSCRFIYNLYSTPIIPTVSTLVRNSVLSRFSALIACKSSLSLSSNKLSISVHIVFSVVGGKGMSFPASTSVWSCCTIHKWRRSDMSCS